MEPSEARVRRRPISRKARPRMGARGAHRRRSALQLATGVSLTYAISPANLRAFATDLQSLPWHLQCSRLCRAVQNMKTLRHPPSRELWKFCMDRLRELRGPDTRERDLANILGFEHSRAVRWKEGQMYVDRAEYLVRLADALDVETMMLVALASGTLTQEQAAKQVGRSRTDEVGKRRRSAGGNPPVRLEAADLNVDASLFAIDASRLEGASRGVILLISNAGEGRVEMAEALSRHGDTGGLVATSLSMGI